MVRGNGWKYIRYDDGAESLYNLREDPMETRNLAGEEALVETKLNLRREIDQWLKSTSA